MYINYIKNVYGADEATTKLVKKKLGINLNLFTKKKIINTPFKLTSRLKTKFFKIRKKNRILGEEAQLMKISNIDFYAEKAHTYKGIRHNNNYPVRGQRTKTNRFTARKLNSTTKSRKEL